MIKHDNDLGVWTNPALWVVAIVLAAAFAGSGIMKQRVPKDKLVTSGQGWAQDFSPTAIRLIGLAEILGAIGLVLPAAALVAPILIPVAGTELVLLMLGAVVVHARCNEPINIAVNVALIALAVLWPGDVSDRIRLRRNEVPHTSARP